MDYAYWKTLSLDQKAYFIGALKKFDAMMNGLISSAADAAVMKKPTGKLSTNLDFKKKGMAYLDRFADYVVKGGISRDFLTKAIELASYEIQGIVEGQPRQYVRGAINQARCDVIYSFELAERPLIDFVSTHQDVHGTAHKGALV